MSFLNESYNTMNNGVFLEKGSYKPLSWSHAFILRSETHGCLDYTQYTYTQLNCL